MLRRSVTIPLKFTLSIGHLHPHLHAMLSSYRSLLLDLSLSQEEIRKHIGKLGQEAGFDSS
jgi:hypothetical protein